MPVRCLIERSEQMNIWQMVSLFRSKVIIGNTIVEIWVLRIGVAKATLDEVEMEAYVHICMEAASRVILRC